MGTMSDPSVKLIENEPTLLARQTPRYNVAASYDDQAIAQKAAAALRSLSIEIELLAVDETPPVIASPPTVSPSPQRTSLAVRAIWSGFLWGVPGALVGGLIGLAIGSLGVDTPLFGTNIALEVASWAMFLHIAAALCGVYITLTDDEAWGIEPADSADASPASIHLALSDRSIVDRAERVLWDAGAIRITERDEVGGTRTWTRSGAHR